MPDETKPRIEAERGILRIDRAQLRRLREILEFLRDIHLHIDPDRFRIDADRVRSMLGAFGGDGIEERRIGVTYEDLLFLETAVEAADTYSHRRGFPALDGLDDEDFSELLDWLTQQEDALFRQPPTIH